MRRSEIAQRLREAKLTYEASDWYEGGMTYRDEIDLDAIEDLVVETLEEQGVEVEDDRPPPPNPLGKLIQSVAIGVTMQANDTLTIKPGAITVSLE